MSINAARETDKSIKANLEKNDLDAWLDHYGIVRILTRVSNETTPDKLNAAIHRVFRANAPLLWDSYVNHYMNDKEDMTK